MDTIDKVLVPIFNEVMNFRNEVVHGINTPSTEEFSHMIRRIKFLNDAIKDNNFVNVIEPIIRAYEWISGLSISIGGLKWQIQAN